MDGGIHTTTARCLHACGPRALHWVRMACWIGWICSGALRAALCELERSWPNQLVRSRSARPAAASTLARQHLGRALAGARVTMGAALSLGLATTRSSWSALSHRARCGDVEFSHLRAHERRQGHVRAAGVVATSKLGCCCACWAQLQPIVSHTLCTHLHCQLLQDG